MARHNELGRLGEEKALQYLRSKGYQICVCNWKYQGKDLDIVALTPEKDFVAIVEVKTRSSEELASAYDAVDIKKIRNLAIAADAYIKQNNEIREVRFDIIKVVGQNLECMEVEHIESAFNPNLI